MTKIEYKNQRGPMGIFLGRRDKRKKNKQSIVTNHHMLLSYAAQKKEDSRRHFHSHYGRASLATGNALHAQLKRCKSLPHTDTWRTYINNFLHIKNNYST